MTKERGWVEWREMVDIKNTYFPLNNTFSIATTRSSVTDIFKVLLPIFLLHLMRMRGVGGKKIFPIVN